MDMQRDDNTPMTMDEMLRALADGELDFRDQPQVLAKIAEDPKAAQRLAQEQQLKQACAKAMDGPEMKCPEALAGELLAMAGDASKKTTAPQPAPMKQTEYAGPPVIARIGRWVPTAIAAVLLLAAGVLFNQASNMPAGTDPGIITIGDNQIKNFTGRHFDCAERPDRLKNPDQFGGKDFEQLPGKLRDYFNTDTNKLALNLDGIGYDYQLTGTCSLPGSGAVHIVYHKQGNPDQSISVWIVPTTERHDKIEEDRVYAEVGDDLLRPVIFWRDGGLLYYLVGDSLEDCDKAVKELRQAI
jgi:hypothetical protein